MLKINFQILINVHNFKLLSARHSSFYQLRLNVFSQTLNSHKTYPLIPYLILTPSKNPKQPQPKISINPIQSQIPLSKNQFETKSASNHEAQSRSQNLSQIDSQTNSFLTKAFVVRQVDHFIPIDEIVVFKGSFEISVSQMTNYVTSQADKRAFVNKLYVNCQLFMVNSFSAESIGEWYGYTLADEGTVALPICFFSYNSSFSQAQITFLWTSIQFTQDQTIQQISEKQIQNISQFLKSKLDYVATKLLKELPLKHHQMPGSTLKNPVQNLKQSISQYNQQVYSLWRRYQELQQKSTQTQNNLSTQSLNQKLKQYEQNLAEYHWKNHIIVTQEIQPQTLNQQNELSQQSQDQIKQSLYIQEKKNRKMPAQLAKLKKDPNIDANLLFYPFENHQRMIKLANQDFKKIASISSLSQRFITRKTQLQKNQKIHLIIFVHGYQASGFDMQNLAAFFKCKEPNKIKTYVSTSNEGRTQQPIQQSGHRLAIQIKNYINNKLQKQDFQISLVCHSMGGLISRAALKYLQLYKSKFKTFLSLCSPHLGYLYHTSTLVKTSLWVLNQVKKDPSMIQLTMQDNAQLQKTFLYQLSTKSELEWFKYPIFIGSSQDEYIPFWSALVRDKDFFFETKQAKVYKMLFKNLTQKIEPKIIRLEAIYKVKINDISSFVGRTAHIRILNCIEVMEMIYLLTQKAF